MLLCKHDKSETAECLCQRLPTEFDCIRCIASGFSRDTGLIAEHLDRCLARPADGHNLALLIADLNHRLDLIRSWMKMTYPKEVAEVENELR